MFNETQKEALAAPLNAAKVKQRSQAGRSLSYIEGWWAIAEANRIFGFDGWTRETIDIRCVSEKPRKVGQGDGFGVTYIARVRITVGEIVREGCGTGHGIDRDLGQAHESALKEAETDAMKRALMTFGNPFGLALYDKEQAGVEHTPEPDQQPSNGKPQYEDTDGQMQAWIDQQKTFLNNCSAVADVQHWEELRADAMKRLHSKNLKAWGDLTAFKEARIRDLQPKKGTKAA
jgi:DNA recombination protein Rad52